MRQIFEDIIEILKIILLALLIVLPIRYFVFQPFVVKGISMEPSFTTGDYLIVDELSYHWRDPLRGEVVVFRYPQDPSEKFIKRVIGLPGETIYLYRHKLEVETVEGRKIVFPFENFIDETASIKLGPDEFFVVGDNHLHSFDSRSWGSLKRKFIIGRVIFRLFPPSRIDSYLSPSI